MLKYPLVSVVVPFYNARAHLKNCLNCLLLQDCNFFFEIIFIDDKSTDNSHNLIKDSKKKNIKVKIFKLDKNSGPSVARNYGLSKARGKYIFFLDSDDLIEKSTLSTLYLKSQNEFYDIIFCDFKLIENSKNLRKKIFTFSEDKNFEKKDFLIALKERIHNPSISRGGLFSCTGRLIKRSIIQKNKIFFEKELRYLEDESFSWDLVGSIKNAKYVRKQFYSYNVNPNVDTAISSGLLLGYPIENFKLVRNHINRTLKKLKMKKFEINKLSDQAFIFFIISALISITRSIFLKKIDKNLGLRVRKRMIHEILSDKEVKHSIKNYSASPQESKFIPLAIAWRGTKLLELACDFRAKQIIKLRRMGEKSM